MHVWQFNYSTKLLELEKASKSLNLFGKKDETFHTYTCMTFGFFLNDLSMTYMYVKPNL